MEDVKMDCNCCCASRELTIIEEIDALPIEERIKERIISKVSEQNSNYDNIKEELYECHYEIERLQKAVLYLSKEIGKCKERN